MMKRDRLYREREEERRRREESPRCNVKLDVEGKIKFLAKEQGNIDEDEDDDDEEDDDGDNGADDVDDDEDNGKSSKPKKRRQYSKVWNDFIVIKKVNHLGKSEERAMCKHCKSDYAYNAHKNGTNTYRRHLQICKLVPRNGDISQMMVNAEAKLQARKIDQSVFRELVAKTIIQHDLPFSYVEYERVRETWKYLNADVKFFSRNTAAADVYKFYEIETDKLKRELAQLPGRISLTTDLWSALTHEVNESSQDEVIRNMIVLMKERFDKYWAEVSDIFAIATVFDPRLKLTLADYCFAKLDISTREKRMKHLRAQLRKLFEVYENKSSAVSPTTESREDVTHDDETAKGNFSNYDDFFAFRKANVVANGKSTLDMYLDEPAMNVKGFKSLDILNYWKDNGPRFGKLASMACDILSIV
ncbi:Zinc finger C2H2 superfamily [Arabidopsis thaliana x Arabidopsis arenosa]|uniref:Zinc finger C2H2 superfamily n=1 Tax=Arabidopsis thaliana x Arabidopsis arenosa TaxID=1240361 RepID=A0A8T2CWN1_9BRAS|nr:Zinc finger C2H2 superfamily [Arabidopsis thaliana x Arabidopsis arenosa]